jgi:hypothetical protein
MTDSTLDTDEGPHDLSRSETGVSLQEVTLRTASTEFAPAESNSAVPMQSSIESYSYERPHEPGSSNPPQRDRGNGTHDSSYHTSGPENVPSGIDLDFAHETEDGAINHDVFFDYLTTDD